MNNRGMTLLELMFAVGILTSVMGVLFGLAISFGDTAQLQNIKATSNDENRRALLFIVPDLHQAIWSSIDLTQLPGPQLTYRVPADLDGNGLPVDMGGRLERSGLRTIQRDTDDINGDGLTASQLIVTDGTTTRVLANELSVDSEGPDENGVFGPDEDANANGQMDRGIWFEAVGRSLRVTLQTNGTDRRGRVLRTTVLEAVSPRN
jgi:type II secretory pathway pseudopilin PulG